MAESSKRNPRKSKLVPRECLEVDEVLFATANLEGSKQTLLEKIKTTNDNDTENLDASPKSVEFSIQVEVEPCLGKSLEPEPEAQEYYTSSYIPLGEMILSNDVITRELEVTSQKATSFVENRLKVEAYNCLGKSVVPPPLDEHEKMIQEVLAKCRTWALMSKLRLDVLVYKCITCSLGWWHLRPFAEHIKIHKNVKLGLERLNFECCIIATSGEWFESMCQIYVEEPCYRCLKSYKEHLELKRKKVNGHMYYSCTGCGENSLTSCRGLFAHEGSCARFTKMLYASGVVASEEEWVCTVCRTFCLTEDRYTQHMTRCHDVRSDDPMIAQQPSKECTACGLAYFIHSNHTCPKRADNHKCLYCWRRFQSRALLELHMTVTAGSLHCPVCHVYLKTQCNLSKHLLAHSKLYSLCYKCTECADNVILATDQTLLNHKKTCHNAKEKKRGFFNTLILPKQCLSTEYVATKEQITEMVLLNEKPPTKEDLKKAEEKREQLKTIMKKRMEHIQQADKLKKDSENTMTYMSHVSKDIANKMLKRVRARNTDSLDSDISIRSNDEIENAVNSLQDDSNFSIKKEIDEDSNDVNIYDDLKCDDNDIDETDNSVNALLSNINMKQEVDIDIEEPDLMHYVSKESQESYIKQEPDTDKNDVSEVKGKVDDEQQCGDDDVEIVDVKQDSVNECIYISDDDEFEKEQQACLEELSKVFQAVRKSKSLKFANSQGTEFKIKAEPLDKVATTSDNVEEKMPKIAKVKTETSEDNSKSVQVNEEMNLKEATVKVEIDKEQLATTSKSAKESEMRPKIKNSIKESLSNNHEIKESIKKIELENHDIEESVPAHEIKKNPIDKILEVVKNSKKRVKKNQQRSLLKCNQKNDLSDQIEESIQQSNAIELTNLQACEVTVKDEAMDIDYEEDIIVISNNHGSSLEVQIKSETLNSSNEEEFTKFPENGAAIVKNRSEDLGKGKLYGCRRCDFVGKHKDYAQHLIGFGCRDTGCPFGKLTCTKCDETYDSMMRYLNHFSEYHEYPKLTCPECFKAFPRSYLVKHLDAHVKKSFVKLHVLKQLAYFTTSGTGVRECKKCQAQVVYKNFFQHWEQHLKLKGDFEKEINSERVESDKKQTKKEKKENSDAQYRHMTFNVNSKSRVENNFELLNNEVKDLVDQLLSDEKPKSCVNCDRVFVRNNDLKRHVIEHLLGHAYATAEQGILQCPVCPQKWENGIAYKVHMRTHGGLTIYRCEICDRCFSDSSNFAKHKKVHNINSCSCDICGKKFTLKKHLEKHMEEQHIKTAPRQCDLCPTMCYNESDMQRHVRRKHQQKRTTFRCLYCREAFPRLKLLWDHLWETHKVRKITADCPICNKSFRKYHQVKVHMQKEHVVDVTSVAHNWAQRHPTTVRIPKEKKKPVHGLQIIKKNLSVGRARIICPVGGSGDDVSSVPAPPSPPAPPSTT